MMTALLETHRLVLGSLVGLHDSVKMLSKLLSAVIRTKQLLRADKILQIQRKQALRLPLVMVDHLLTNSPPFRHDK